MKVLVNQRWLAVCTALITCLFGVALGAAPGRDTGKDQKAANPPAARKFKVLILEGTPYNRGLTHGKAMKEEQAELEEKGNPREAVPEELDKPAPI